MYRSHDLISIRRQAHEAAEFLMRRGPGPVYVFPCKRTGHAKEFREYLSMLLAITSRNDREINERVCKESGFPFVEVDPADYK